MFIKNSKFAGNKNSNKFDDKNARTKTIALAIVKTKLYNKVFWKIKKNESAIISMMMMAW